MYYYKYPNLLLSKSLIFNITAFCLFLYTVYTGYINFILEIDTTYISMFIMILTFVFSIHSIFKAYLINKELIKLKSDSNVKDVLYNITGGENLDLKEEKDRDTLKLALSMRISIIKYVSRILVILGLIGTVVGSIMLFIHGNISVGDIDALKKLIPMLIKGLGIALFTTLIGSIGSIILDINHRMLSKASMEEYTVFLLKNHLLQSRTFLIEEKEN